MGEYQCNWSRGVPQQLNLPRKAKEGFTVEAILELSFKRVFQVTYKGQTEPLQKSGYYIYKGKCRVGLIPVTNLEN